MILRQDNADERLTPLGHEIGLISDKRYEKFLQKQELINAERRRIEKTSVPLSDELQQILVSHETSPLKKGCKLIELLKRPSLNYKALEPVDHTRPDLPKEIFEQVEISVKYEGYIKRQEAQIKEMRRLEKKIIPEGIDFNDITGLRLEALEKLNAVRPHNVGQASRISGVTPADISVILIYLAKTE